jgi:thioredoxin reductase
VRNTPLRQVITAVADGGLAAINVRSYLAALKQQKE